MVLTAVKHSEFVLSAPVVGESASVKKAAANTESPKSPQAESISPLASNSQPRSISKPVDLPVNVVASAETSVEKKQIVEVEDKPLKREKATDPAKKPLFWSAALKGGETAKASEIDQIPSILRNLQKCKACGFPVSQGRTYCVECEEKQWRGHPLPQPAAVASAELASDRAAAEKPAAKQSEAVAVQDGPETAVPAQAQEKVLVMAAAASAAPSVTMQLQKTAAVPESATAQNPLHEVPPQPSAAPSVGDLSADSHETANSFLSSALPAESWLAANKYVLFAVAAVVVVVAGIFLFH
jgi:uncharacterized Zn finger protein (UPF0148 family)